MSNYREIYRQLALVGPKELDHKVRLGLSGIRFYQKCTLYHVFFLKMLADVKIQIQSLQLMKNEVHKYTEEYILGEIKFQLILYTWTMVFIWGPELCGPTWSIKDILENPWGNVSKETVLMRECL